MEATVLRSMFLLVGVYEKDAIQHVQEYYSIRVNFIMF